MPSSASRPSATATSARSCGVTLPSAAPPPAGPSPRWQVWSSCGARVGAEGERRACLRGRSGRPAGFARQAATDPGGGAQQEGAADEGGRCRGRALRGGTRTWHAMIAVHAFCAAPSSSTPPPLLNCERMSRTDSWCVADGCGPPHASLRARRRGRVGAGVSAERRASRPVAARQAPGQPGRRARCRDRRRPSRDPLIRACASLANACVAHRVACGVVAHTGPAPLLAARMIAAGASHAARWGT